MPSRWKAIYTAIVAGRKTAPARTKLPSSIHRSSTVGLRPGARNRTIVAKHLSRIPLKISLRDDQNVARHQRDVAVNIAVVDQAVEVHRMGFLDVVDGPDKGGAVAGGIFRQAAD